MPMTVTLISRWYLLSFARLEYRAMETPSLPCRLRHIKDEVRLGPRGESS